MQRQLDTMQNEISVLDSHEKSERECCEKLRAEVLQCREERDGMVFKASQLNAKLQNLESRVESRRQGKQRMAVRRHYVHPTRESVAGRDQARAVYEECSGIKVF